MRRFIGQLLRAALGPEHSRNDPVKAALLADRFADRLKNATAHCASPIYSSSAPVFIFSAGWRSGSTLLQRMLMQHNEHLVIWGEPFFQSNVLETLMAQMRGFTEYWPRDSYFLSKRQQQNLSDQSVSNLYPDVDALFAAHLKFLIELLEAPAIKAGYSQWGVKEVRWGSDQALYLKQFFPNAKFIYLYRNPLDAYASFYKICTGWFVHWPKGFVATPYAFGKQWAKLTQDFIENHSKTGGVLVRYEDLDSESHVTALCEYLGWSIPRSSQLRRLFSDHVERKVIEPTVLPTVDTILLKAACGPLMKRAGY